MTGVHCGLQQGVALPVSPQKAPHTDQGILLQEIVCERKPGLFRCVGLTYIRQMHCAQHAQVQSMPPTATVAVTVASVQLQLSHTAWRCACHCTPGTVWQAC